MALEMKPEHEMAVAQYVDKERCRRQAGQCSGQGSGEGSKASKIGFRVCKRKGQRKSFPTICFVSIS